MGIDWNSLWGKAQDAVDKGLDQVVKTGVPALQASLEKWGIEVLEKQHEATTAKLQEQVQAAVKEPAKPGTFGHAMQETIKGAALEQYGPMILLGIGAAVAVGLFLRK